MILPHEEFPKAILMAKKWLEDPTTIILAVGKYGVVLRHEDAELTITRTFAAFEIKKETQ